MIVTLFLHAVTLVLPALFFQKLHLRTGTPHAGPHRDRNCAQKRVCWLTTPLPVMYSIYALEIPALQLLPNSPSRELPHPWHFVPDARTFPPQYAGGDTANLKCTPPVAPNSFLSVEAHRRLLPLVHWTSHTLLLVSNPSKTPLSSPT